MSGADDFSRYAVEQLRSASARYPTGALAVLVAGLRADSQEFAPLWDSGDVPIGQHRAKSVDHPLAGHLDLSCDVLTIPDRDQQLVLLTAAPPPPPRALHRLTPDRVPDCTLAINPVEESLLNGVPSGDPTAD